MPGRGGQGARLGAGRAQRGEVDPDPGASLQGEHGFTQGIEYAVDAVLQRPRHKAIEQRQLTRRASTGQDASPRQKAKVTQNGAKALAPLVTVHGLDTGDRQGNTVPSGLHRRLLHVPVLTPAVMGSPDMLGDGGGKWGLVHGATSGLTERFSLAAYRRRELAPSQGLQVGRQRKKGWLVQRFLVQQGARAAFKHRTVHRQQRGGPFKTGHHNAANGGVNAGLGVG